MTEGFVKIPRIIQDSRSYNRGSLHRALLMTILLKANWKSGSFCGEDIVAGQFAGSVNSLAEELNEPRTTVQRAILDLVNDGFIKIEKVGRKWSRFTIINWDSYQQNENTSGPQMVSKRADDGPILGTIEEKKESKNIKTDSFVITQESKSTTEQKQANTKTPSGFVPPTLDDVRDYIRGKNKDVDPEEFYEYYSELGWKVKGKTMKSWKLTISTWDKRERSKPKDQFTTGRIEKRDTPEQLRQIAMIHKDWDPLVLDFQEAGIWHKAAEWEEQIEEMIAEVRMGIPYIPCEQQH